MTVTMEPTTVSYEDYAGARNALEALGRERAAVLSRGLEALRRWLRPAPRSGGCITSA